MNVTFLIGNGFDLNLGLETRYSDFYKYYLENDPEDLISKSIKKVYELWSDLELGLGILLEDIDENQIEEFLDSKATLEKLLVKYLKTQNERVKFTDEAKILEAFKTAVVGLNGDFNKEDRDQYSKTIKNTREIIQYSFIVFNYTDVLDRIINIAIKDENYFASHVAGGARYIDVIDTPIHIHGELTENLVLGLDNINQVRNEKIKNDPRIINYIIKANLNRELGEGNIELTKDKIDKSTIICIYGMSLGETDGMWWEYLIEWLGRSSENRLVIYGDERGDIKLLGQERIRHRDANRKIMIERGRCEDNDIINRISNRIIIVPKSKIFDFENISILESSIKPNK
ncbi:MAG: AbiH family protein [Bacillota bacterium]|nr:AbiH family protein [Bacillota bacterium]